MQYAFGYQLLPNELRLYLKADKSAALVFQPTVDPFLYHSIPLLRQNCEYLQTLPLIQFSRWTPAWCWLP